MIQKNFNPYGPYKKLKKFNDPLKMKLLLLCILNCGIFVGVFLLEKFPAHGMFLILYSLCMLGVSIYYFVQEIIELLKKE